MWAEIAHAWKDKPWNGASIWVYRVGYIIIGIGFLIGISAIAVLILEKM